jgi:hypothetical protein
MLVKTVKGEVNICIFLSDDTENIKSKTKLFHAAV